MNFPPLHVSFQPPLNEGNLEDKALLYGCKIFQKSPCGTWHRGLTFPLPRYHKFIASYRGSEPVWTDRAAKRCTATIPSFKLHTLRSQGFLQTPRSKPWLLKFLHCPTPFVPTPATPAPASHGRHLPPPAGRPHPKLSQPNADPFPSTAGGRGRPGQDTAPARAPSPWERGRGTARVGPAPSGQRPGRPRRHGRPEAAVPPPQEAAGRARHLPAHSAGQDGGRAGGPAHGAAAAPGMGSGACSPAPPAGASPRRRAPGRPQAPLIPLPAGCDPRPSSRYLGHGFGQRARSGPPGSLRLPLPRRPGLGWARRDARARSSLAARRCSRARPAGEGRGGPAIRSTYPPRKHIPPLCRQAGWGGVCGAAGRDGRAVPEAGLGSRFPPASMCATRQRLIWRGLVAERPPGPALQPLGRAGPGMGLGLPRDPLAPAAIQRRHSTPALFQSSSAPLPAWRDSGDLGKGRLPVPVTGR